MNKPDPIELHTIETRNRAKLQYKDPELLEASKMFMDRSMHLKYSYNFTWLGRPIIQYPQDIVALQEAVYKAKPDIIIETGIAHGGSLILSSSLLSMLDLMEGRNPFDSHRKVIGIDIDIRDHNYDAITKHPLSKKIELITGSSIESRVVNSVKEFCEPEMRVLVCLDSCHSHDHVLAELNCYAPLVSKDSYCIVFDTIVEHLPKGSRPDRPWDQGNSPQTALFEWLNTNENFTIDKSFDERHMISVAPNGFLLKTSH